MQDLKNNQSQQPSPMFLIDFSWGIDGMDQMDPEPEPQPEP